MLYSSGEVNLNLRYPKEQRRDNLDRYSWGLLTTFSGSQKENARRRGGRFLKSYRDSLKSKEEMCSQHHYTQTTFCQSNRTSVVRYRCLWCTSVCLWNRHIGNIMCLPSMLVRRPCRMWHACMS